jgi:hypothetical protein
VICTADYLSDWDNLSEEEYKKKKEDVAQKLIKLPISILLLHGQILVEGSPEQS